MTTWIMEEIEPGHLVRKGELVRCGECRFQNEVGTDSGGQIKYCTLRCPMGEDDDYCSKGVRKDELQT